LISSRAHEIRTHYRRRLAWLSLRLIKFLAFHIFIAKGAGLFSPPLVLIVILTPGGIGLFGRLLLGDGGLQRPDERRVGFAFTDLP